MNPLHYAPLAALSLVLACSLANDCRAQRPNDADLQIRGTGYPRLSPFTAMRMSGESLEVIVDGDRWFTLVRIADIATEDLLARTQTICGEDWAERISEDLVEVLSVLGGKPVGEHVDLVLREIGSEKEQVLRRVPMTSEKRQGLLKANRSSPKWSVPFGEAQQIADLETLRTLLDEHFAYRHRVADFDLDAAIAGIRFEKSAPRAAFARQIEQLIAGFGDAHSRVSIDEREATRHLPCLLVEVEDDGVTRLAAIHADRSRAIDARHPFVTAIDGVEIERWLQAARSRVTQGSAQQIARDAMRELRSLDALRTELGLPLRDHVELKLSSGKPPRSKTVKLPAASRRPIYGDWPRRSDRDPAVQHRLLADETGIGYLRIAAMDDDATTLAAIDRAMQEFRARATAGMVLDLRGNGGGTRDALRRLFPYFVRANDEPHVANIAACKLPPDARDRGTPRDGWLTDRGLYPADWHGWTDAQRQAIVDAMPRFQPTWSPPDRETFSEWHYFLLDRSDNQDAYHFDRPVVVLLDDGCFSATDIMLGALVGRPGITLLGTPSSGGSGRARRHTLPCSGIEVRLSSMISYRPNGRLYDGDGIAPDVRVARTRVSDHLLDGGTDTQLDAAIALLR